MSTADAREAEIAPPLHLTASLGYLLQ